MKFVDSCQGQGQLGDEKLRSRRVCSSTEALCVSITVRYKPTFELQLIILTVVLNLEKMVQGDDVGASRNCVDVYFFVRIYELVIVFFCFVALSTIYLGANCMQNSVASLSPITLYISRKTCCSAE